MSAETLCPVCGRPPPDVTPRDVEVCLPSSCPAWTTVAIYDHEQRDWLPVDADGFVLDGRREGEVK